MFYIYILYSVSLNKFYVGQSEDPWERAKRHNKGEPKNFTGKAHDWELRAVFQIRGNRAKAMELERYIKDQKSRSLILKLVDPNFNLTGNLESLVRVPYSKD